MDSNPKSYKGIANIGATCYMNSLLQTLFMTPEFREAIYRWKYNERVHPEPRLSILYQIQRLFGKLERCFPGEVNTKDLVVSFSWDDDEIQSQQDIQEFNRVLFEALEESLLGKVQSHRLQTNHFLRDLYEGEMIQYTSCKECLHESQREETFQDIILTVKNPYEKIYNGNIELGIQRYMKPEILDYDNMYSCQTCAKKVRAERGVRFLKMPKLLNVILRRFDYDYYLSQRVKVNDRVEFPHILNFNKYMQGYDSIPQKLDEENPEYFQSYESKKTSFPAFTSTRPRKVVSKKPLVTNIAGKKTTKPSAITKSFLKDMRKKKMMSQNQNEDLIFVSGQAQILANSTASSSPTRGESSTREPETDPPSRKTQSSIQLETRQQVVEKSENSNGVKRQLGKEQQIAQERDIKSKGQAQLINGKDLPKPPPLNLTPPQLSQPQQSLPSKQNNLQSQLADKIKQKQRLNTEKQQRLSAVEVKNKQLIEEYLKEGPLVYELYSVMIHNGSATHGHYYSYIKSFENGKWYCFNDERVSEINVDEIEKTFGGTGGSNAYALYYRLVDSENRMQDRTIRLPAYIESSIDQEIESFRIREAEKFENLENVLTLKMHYQLYVKQLEIRRDSTLKLVLEKAREMFGLTQEMLASSNCRLRMYNPTSDTKLETFTGQQNETLEALNILSFKSMIIETKKSEETFEEFIVGKINLRIVLWEISGKEIQSLDESFLRVFKVSVRRGATMKQIESQIRTKREEVLSQCECDQETAKNPNICVIKRHQNDEYSYHEIVNIGEFQEKTMDDLMIIQNEILFIEPKSDQLMWPREFENQLYRITIRFNNLSTGKSENYLTDSRKTLCELKKQLCLLSGCHEDEIILRRGNKSGMELKNLSLTMKDSRFITSTIVYLEKGLPAKPGEVRVQLFMAKDAPQEFYNRLHEFQYVVDVPVGGLWKASEVKDLFMKVIKNYRGIDLLDKHQFRIREKVCDKLGKIYRERPMKEQQLIEKREIAIELKPDEIDMKDFAIYLKIWNPDQWTLSGKIQISVNKNTSMKDLTQLLFSINSDIECENMQICRILSINKFNILDLCEMEYFDIQDVSVIAEPLFVNADGLLFIVKDKHLQPRALTKDEEIKFGGRIKNYQVKSKAKNPNSCASKKEKGMTIRVTNKNGEDYLQAEGECQLQKHEENNSQKQAQIQSQKHEERDSQNQMKGHSTKQIQKTEQDHEPQNE